MITSVVRRTNDKLIAAACSLYVDMENDLVLDPTYGSGKFWKLGEPRRLVKHDLKLDGVSYRNLPERSRTIDRVILDIPYVSVGGRQTSTLKKFQKTYGMDLSGETPALVSRDMARAISESYRVLVPRGILMLKSCNYISGGKFHPGHYLGCQAALHRGFQFLDEFILHSGTGPQPLKNLDGTPRRQVHARRAHSYLTVFLKSRNIRA